MRDETCGTIVFHMFRGAQKVRTDTTEDFYNSENLFIAGRPSAPREFCLSIEIDYQNISGKATWYSLGTGLQMR